MVVGSWDRDISNVSIMRGLFRYASSFDRSLADWNVSSVTNMAFMLSASGVSDTNKGLIHQSFSSNSNWPYDWSSFVNPNYTPLTDANFQTAVNLWFSIRQMQLPTYGHISDWNTSAVTDTMFSVNEPLLMRILEIGMFQMLLTCMRWEVLHGFQSR